MTPNVSIDRHVLLQFKTSLREQQRELQQTIDRVEKDIRGATDSTADNIDLSSCNTTRESMAARNTQNRCKLTLVELALERIQNGSFGACIACDGAIGLRQFQAIPPASRCIECQERLEQGALNVATASIPTSFGEFIENPHVVGRFVVPRAPSKARSVNNLGNRRALVVVEDASV